MSNFEPDEALITEICSPTDNETHELTIRYKDDVLRFFIDNKEVFTGDWTGNFLEVFKRALKLWDSKEE